MCPPGGFLGRPLADFYNAVACFQAGLDAWPHPLKSRQQLLGSTVAKPHPDELYRSFWAPSQVEEVLILADENHPVFSGVPADLDVGGPREPQVEYVGSLFATGGEESRQRGGELVIDQEFHEAWTTGWSAWCAAYSIAARMSSRSKNG